jgi:transmembrane sensor
MKADRKLRASLREPHDEARAHANWDAIARRRRRTSDAPTRRAPLFGGLAIGAAVAVVIALVMLRVVPGPLVRDDGRVAAGLVDHEVLALDDGSRVAIEPGGRLEVLENAGDHIRFWLHEGAARFDVVPGGPRRWVIETGLVTVEVLGTAFRVEHGAEHVTVSVERGSVLVRGPTAPGGMRRLAAGESISVSTGERPLVTAAVEEATEEEVSPAHPIETSEPPARESVAAAEAAAPLRASHEAPVSAPEAVREEEEEEQATVARGEARLRDADALRAEGRLDEAIAMLQTIADDTTAGNERALAAFTLARLELDRRHHPVEAAAAFTHAIDLGLREPLLEDARARRVEALARASDVAGARLAADTYLSHHPSGRWRSEVERWCATP